MSSISDFYDMAALAEASYVLFDLLRDYSENKIVSALTSTPLDPNIPIDYKGKLSTSQANEFVQTWDIVYHQRDTDNSGFSATLFKNKFTGNYVYSLRGTAGGQDLFSADIGDIVTDGLAIKQIVDMYNDWQRINTGANESYQAACLDLQQTETDLLLEERTDNEVFGIVGSYEESLRARTDIVIEQALGSDQGN